jgi:4-amino-4-deoxy-L-arabinose transferase-like glycosyltransferase
MHVEYVMSLNQTRRPSLWVEISLLVAILAVAAFLRLTQLDRVPPGMTHDEAAFGAEAEMILAGERPTYFALGYGHEPLYAYLVALAFSLLGRTLSAIRVTSAVCGLLVVLGTYLLARRLFGAYSALISAAWMAVAFWPLSLSRQALRAVTLPMLWLPAAWAMWGALRDAGFKVQGSRYRVPVERGASQDRRTTANLPSTFNFQLSTCNYVLSGLLLGATLYTYMASRVTWVVYPLFALYLLLQRGTRALLKRAWPGIVITLAIAGLVALPLLLYLRAHPAEEIRVDTMMEPIRELFKGNPQRVLRHTWNALRLYSWVGDRFWAYNIPERPVFDWVGSLLFYAGLASALWQWKDPRYAFLLLSLVVGMAPAMVTTNEGIFLRAIVAQPITYVLVAEGLRPSSVAPRASVCVARMLRDTACSRLRISHLTSHGLLFAIWVILAVSLTTVEGIRSYKAYFVEWPNRPEARNIYNHNMVATARYLRDQPESGAVGISALYPRYYHDPWILRYIAGRDDLQIRWFGDREPYPAACIVYPAEGEARYVFSALTLLDPALRPHFESQAKLIEQRTLAEDDQNPYFEVWRWQGSAALADQLQALEAASPTWVSPEVHFTQPERRRFLDSPAQFGDVMALVGYRWSGTLFQPGDVIELITYWRALRTVEAEDDWVTFVHLLDANSQLLGSIDVLHCPPTGWYPGDIAVQVHRFAIADSAPRAKVAYLEVGVYRRSTGRLPVMDGTEPIGDRVLLSPIEIQ